MHRIHCCPYAVKNIYLQRMKDKMCDEELYRDDRHFLDLKKKICLYVFPHNEGVFENDDGNEAAL